MQTIEQVVFILNQDDIESAVRDFVCRCHPQFSTGFTVEVEIENNLTDVRATATASKEKNN
jgi:hypothetical protein